MSKDNFVELSINNDDKITILGLDCSSSTIGWGFTKMVDNNPTLLSYGYIKPLDNKYAEIIRLDDVYKRISELCIKLKPTFVAIEDIFLFMKGHSSAKTITVLTAFNRISSLAAYHNSENIFYYSVHDIRKIIGKHYNIKEKISKEDIPDIIISYLDNRFNKIINKNGKIKKEVFDESDGIAVSLAALLQYYNNILNVKKTLRIKKKEKK